MAINQELLRIQTRIGNSFLRTFYPIDYRSSQNILKNIDQLLDREVKGLRSLSTATSQVNAKIGKTLNSMSLELEELQNSISSLESTVVTGDEVLGNRLNNFEQASSNLLNFLMGAGALEALRRRPDAGSKQPKGKTDAPKTGGGTSVPPSGGDGKKTQAPDEEKTKGKGKYKLPKGMTVIALAISLWTMWEELLSLDSKNMSKGDYRQAVLQIVARAVATLGLTWVGAFIGAAVGSAFFGVGAIPGFIFGLLGGMAADYAFGEDVNQIVDQVVDYLYTGEEEETPQETPAPGEQATIETREVPSPDLAPTPETPPAEAEQRADAAARETPATPQETQQQIQRREDQAEQEVNLAPTPVEDQSSILNSSTASLAAAAPVLTPTSAAVPAQSVVQPVAPIIQPAEQQLSVQATTVAVSSPIAGPTPPTPPEEQVVDGPVEYPGPVEPADLQPFDKKEVETPKSQNVVDESVRKAQSYVPQTAEEQEKYTETLFGQDTDRSQGPRQTGESDTQATIDTSSNQAGSISPQESVAGVKLNFALAGKERSGMPDPDILGLVQRAAAEAGMTSITITSGRGDYISEAGRKKGQKSTVHSTGKAVDVAGFADREQKIAFARAARALGAGGIGVYRSNILHVDLGEVRHWNWGDPSFPKLGEGAKVSKPTLALIGEAGEPEYVVPQSKVIKFAHEMVATRPQYRTKKQTHVVVVPILT